MKVERSEGSLCWAGSRFTGLEPLGSVRYLFMQLGRGVAYAVSRRGDPGSLLRPCWICDEKMTLWHVSEHIGLPLSVIIPPCFTLI
jgi:hypothetical protein